MVIPNIAYQGAPGAYSDMAIKKFFPGQAQGRPRNTFEALFEAVASEKANFGMVPIENSIAGSVCQNYDLLAKYNKKEAAIASSEAARIYKLEILKRRIETNKKNFTRFVVISRQSQTTWANKGSIIFSMAHKPGALYKILAPFVKEEINLTKIESRPIIGRPWEYLIYLDFEAKSIKKKWSRMEKHLQKKCSYLKVLGFYRKGKTSAS